jgi:hypothetical protein
LMDLEHRYRIAVRALTNDLSFHSRYALVPYRLWRLVASGAKVGQPKEYWMLAPTGDDLYCPCFALM